MKVLFWLYKSKVSKKGLTPIMMRITLKGERINFPTQISIEEKQWDKGRLQIKGTDELTIKYNQYLLNLKTKAWEVYTDSKKNDEPICVKQIKEYVLGTHVSTYTLMETIGYHINQLKARIGHDIAAGTVKNYEACKHKVELFLQQARGVEDIFLSELNHQFVQELDVFMRVKQRLHNNGVVKHMQQLKRVIRVAMQNEWLTKDPFVHYQSKIVEPKRVHLTKEELQTLEQLPLPSDRLNRVRDVFVFSCYTGLAYADVSKLSAQHLQRINGMDWIILDRTKTKNQSIIPLLPKAQEMLQKYRSYSGKGLLPVISSQNLNKYLKEVAVLAGINKALSYHAARHTFASTVTLNSGVDIVTVSAMLGHKMLKTTQIYARVNLNKISNDMEKLYKKR